MRVLLIITLPCSQQGSFADVVVKLGLIKLLTRRFDVCEEAERNGAELRCPVAEGDYTITQTVALPKEIPPGECPLALAATA